MSAVTVRQAVIPRETSLFCKGWWRIYQNDPHWVPPLVFDLKAFFDPNKNPYWNTAEAAYFIAFLDDQPVGTIAACVDQGYQSHDPGCGFFGFFEFIDRVDVAQRLFEAACDWLRKQGMVRCLGPFNFNANHEFGLLVRGFDSDPAIANPHNAAYYPGIYEALGLKKALDWYAYRMTSDMVVSAKIKKVSAWFLKRHPEVVIRNPDLRRWNQEVELYESVYNDAWEQNWAHVKMQPDEFRARAQSFKQIIDPSLCFVVEVDGQPAGMSITLPDFNTVVKRMNGSLFPFGWWHFLFGRKRINQIRIFILGVKSAYQHLPLGAPMYLRTWERALALGYQAAEASLVLETNYRMRGALETMGAYAYKTYRTCEYLLSDQVTYSEPTQQALAGQILSDPPPLKPPQPADSNG